MTEQRIDVAALPVLKITPETFDALPELAADARPPEKNGATWKVRLTREPDAPFVILRYVGFMHSPGCSIQMLRPRITVGAPYTTPRTKTGKMVR